jgi:hypothetical protein
MNRVVGSATSHRVCVVVTTYNRPAALSWVLASLAMQDHVPELIVVADDGSGGSTRCVIDQWREYWRGNIPTGRLEHFWQPDEGFRAAAARNGALRLARTFSKIDQVIFLDGDCITRPNFVQMHVNLIGAREGRRSVAGGRGLLSESFTADLESSPPMPLRLAAQHPHLSCQTPVSPHDLSRHLSLLRSPYKLWSGNHLDRWLPMLSLPHSILGQSWRDWRPQDTRMVRTCNFSLWLDDFDAIQGFNEAFVGWGLEDTELAVRLIKSGVRIRSGRMAANVFHLWHPEASRCSLEANECLLRNAWLDTSSRSFASTTGNPTVSHSSAPTKPDRV